MKFSASLSFEKKENKFSQILFGVLAAFGLYSLSGILLIFLAKIPFVFNYFRAVFVPFYLILLVLSFITIRNQKIFKYSYLTSSLVLLLYYIVIYLLPLIKR
mgnify:CR=1 FL=1